MSCMLSLKQSPKHYHGNCSAAIVLPFDWSYRFNQILIYQCICITFLQKNCISLGLPNKFGSERVIGGTQANSGEFPYVVSISVNEQHICGGFIYSAKWIVTAASCVYGKYPSQLKVTAGEVSLNNVDPGEQIVSVFSLIICEGYDNALKTNDIALLELATSITFGPYVTLGRYDEVNDSISYGTFMGWGTIQTQPGGLPSTKLRKADLTMSAECPTHYTIDEYNQNYMICAGAESFSPCAYDEGSPLVQKMFNEDIVVGIMSKNLECGTNVPPSIFTRISAFYSWLQKNAGLQPTTVLPPTTIPSVTTSETTSSTTTRPTPPTAPCVNCETPSP